MTIDQIRDRIAAIDAMFATAASWGSWMASASSERAGLVRQARAMGVEIADDHVMTDGAGRRLVD